MSDKWEPGKALKEITLMSQCVSITWAQQERRIIAAFVAEVERRYGQREVEKSAAHYSYVSRWDFVHKVLAEYPHDN